MALYRGFLPSMMGVVIYAGTSFFTYESLKHFWSGDGKEAPSPSQRLMSGACAGVLGQVSARRDVGRSSAILGRGLVEDGLVLGNVMITAN